MLPPLGSLTNKLYMFITNYMFVTFPFYLTFLDFIKHKLCAKGRKFSISQLLVCFQYAVIRA